MTQNVVMFVFLVLATFAPTCARASIVWDFSPETTGADLVPGDFGNWVNVSYAGNWAEEVIFSSGVTITGMDVYSGVQWGSVGQGVTIRVWDDSGAGGAPGTLLYNFNESISIIDTDGTGANQNINRKHADFTNPIVLSAGTKYWIGMSGTGTELAQAGLGGVNAPDNGSMAFFMGTTLNNSNNADGDMAFRLHGTATIPEPSTYITLTGLILCFGLAGWRRKRRQAG